MNLWTIFCCILLTSHEFDPVDAFASKLAEQCEKPMEVGVVMMGMPAELNASYHLKLFRHDLTEVASGGNQHAIESFNELYPLKYLPNFYPDRCRNLYPL